MAQRSQIFSSYLLRVAIAVMVLLVGGLLYLRQDVSRDRVYSLSAQPHYCSRPQGQGAGQGLRLASVASGVQ